MIQKIWLSEWCPHKCSFCYNGRKEFIELPIPEITSNEVQILDPAFLTKDNVIGVIKELGLIRYNKKVICYELVQGINYKDLTQEIADELKKSRFINIRFAWDREYNKHLMFKIYDCKEMLIKAGYNSRRLMCYILTNWEISHDDCVKKLDLLKIWRVKVGDCCYDGGYHIKNYEDYILNQKTKLWSYPSLKRFRSKCRKHNQILRGIDPELK